MDALWQSIYASSSKIQKTTGMILWKEILFSSCSCDKASVHHRSPFLAMKSVEDFHFPDTRESLLVMIMEDSRCRVTEEALHWYTSVRRSQLKRSQKGCKAGWCYMVLVVLVLWKKWYFCEGFVWWSDHPLSISFCVYHECHVLISFGNGGLLSDWWGRGRGEGKEGRKGRTCLVLLQGWTNTCFKSR